MLPDELRVEIQSVPDELWAKKPIPFQLTAHNVESAGQEEYIIRFFDGRLPSVGVSWTASIFPSVTEHAPARSRK